MLKPGSTIGILGGGQLGRMLAVAAAQLGYRCHIYAPEMSSVAAEVSADHFHGAWDDARMMAAFVASCDVVTYEFENVPAAPLSAIPADMLAPGTRALEVAQDRLAEKRFVEGLGGRPAPFAGVAAAEQIGPALDKIGTPGIFKTCRDGYDGKGQWRIDASGDAQGLKVPETGLVYEGFVRFEAEFSVILVRGGDGEVRFWDSPQNRHEDGILAHSVVPPESSAIAGQVEEARGLARKVAEALDYVGVLTCEFFATPEGPVFNEMAPRVHNSGHWTIEGAITSQFENHIRAICGLPLGDTDLTTRGAEMRNLIGDQASDIRALLSEPRDHVHIYGKGKARPGRKMGHVTRLLV